MRTQTTKNNAANMAMLFVGGAVAGTALGMLLAPASGQESRRRIRENAQKGVQAVTEGAQELRQRSSDAVETARTTAERVVQNGRNRIEDEKNRLHAAIEEGKRTYQERTAATS